MQEPRRSTVDTGTVDRVKGTVGSRIVGYPGLTLREAAELFGKAPKTIQKAVERGLLHPIRDGGYVKYSFGQLVSVFGSPSLGSPNGPEESTRYTHRFPQPTRLVA